MSWWLTRHAINTSIVANSTNAALTATLNDLASARRQPIHTPNRPTTKALN
jgi:hypothetical protein